MSKFNLLRPDKMLLTGLKAVGNSLYSLQKSEAKGLAQLTFIGEKKASKVESQLFAYNKEDIHEREGIKNFRSLAEPEKDKVHWLNFHGLHDVEYFEKLSKVFQLDRLTLRQILDTTQRPKVDEFSNYLFFNIKSVLKVENGHELEIEQLSFVLFDDMLISFQEKDGDHFDYIRKKIREDLGMIRKRTANYLLIQLMDSILDNYFETVDSIIKDLTEIERNVIRDPNPDSLLIIEKQKRQLQILKSSLLPFSEAINTILNGKTRFIQEDNIKYLKDLKSSCSAALDEIDATNNSLESIRNIYFASLSQKMNETMKVLTLTATIFIPLTFVAGIYGMNFEYMPELQYKYGYFIVLGAMGILLIGMVIFFKIKKWL